MATQWFNHYRGGAHRRSFLLTDGRVIDEPELEESSSGIRVRVKGARESVYKKDRNALIQRELNKRAGRKAQLWMPVDLDGSCLYNEVGFKPAERQAIFDPTSTSSDRVTTWWSFRHPTMPIEAVLQVRLSRVGAIGDVYRVVGKVSFPDTAPDRLTVNALSETDDEFFVGTDRWAEDILGLRAYLSERRGVELLLRRIQLCEELETITIPDLRGNGDDWLELKLHDTNITARFIDDMREYLTGATGVDQALDLYKELRTALRGLGMVLGDLNANDFTKALTTGDKEALTVSLGSPTSDDDDTDDKHVVSVHLPSGTFVVTCTEGATTKDKAAHAWEEAEVRASLTGRQDVLLAYAEEHARTEHNRRTKTIVGRRRAALDTN